PKIHQLLISSSVTNECLLAVYCQLKKQWTPRKPPSLSTESSPAASNRPRTALAHQANVPSPISASRLPLPHQTAYSYLICSFYLPIINCSSMQPFPTTAADNTACQITNSPRPSVPFACMAEYEKIPTLLHSLPVIPTTITISW